MDFMQTVRQRRSVRRFVPKDVPDEALNDILDAARLAPASGGAHRTCFGVVRDDARKRRLAAAAGGQEWIATAPVVIALCARLGPDLADCAPDEPAVRVNVTRFGADLLGHLNAYPDRRAVRVFSDNAVPMIAGEHVALAAVSHGLASCWIGHLDTAEAGRILGLPEDLVCLYLMPIGYPDETPAERAARPFDECVFYEEWSAPRGAS